MIILVWVARARADYRREAGTLGKRGEVTTNHASVYGKKHMPADGDPYQYIVAYTGIWL